LADLIDELDDVGDHKERRELERAAFVAKRSAKLSPEVVLGGWGLFGNFAAA
jgi:predicted secreted acid phosphatase